VKTLAQVIAEHTYGAGIAWDGCQCNKWPGGTRDDHATHVATAWRAERTVTTETALDGLSRYTLIEHRGFPLRKENGAWVTLSARVKVAEPPIPARVLWSPGDEETAP
jgi:hypothetical protein